MKKLLAVLLCLCMLLSMTALAEEAPAAEEIPMEEAALEEEAAHEEEIAEEAAAEEATAEPAEEAGVDYENLAPETVVATLNGEPVTWGECREAFDNLNASYGGYGEDYVAVLAIYETISQRVLELKAVELGFADHTPEELATLYATADADLQAGIASYISYNNPDLNENSPAEDIAAAQADAAAYFEGLGYNQETLRETYVKYNTMEKTYDFITKDVTVSDEDVEAYYQSLVEQDAAKYTTAAAYEEAMMYNQMYAMFGMETQDIWYRPAGYRVVHHILLNVDEELLNKYNELSAAFEEQQNAEEEEPTAAAEPAETEEPAEPAEPVTAQQVEEARLAAIASVQSTVDEIMKKLADGAEFDALIAEYSTDPGAANDYEICENSMSYVPAFVTAGMSIAEVGGISEPALSSYGVHLVKYVRDMEAGGIPLTDASRESLRNDLLQTRKSQAYSAQMGEWMKDYTIEFKEIK